MRQRSSYVYRICRYVHDLHSLGEHCDYAVLVGSSRKCALVGVNLREFGLSEENPLAQGLIDHTLHVTWSAVLKCIETSNPPSGFAIIQGVDKFQPTNLSFTNLVSKRSSLKWEDFVRSMFKKHISNCFRDDAKSAGDTRRWEEEPTISTRELGVIG
jgi:hypothetical protein